MNDHGPDYTPEHESAFIDRKMYSEMPEGWQIIDSVTKAQLTEFGQTRTNKYQMYETEFGSKWGLMRPTVEDGPENTEALDVIAFIGVDVPEIE
jgi:hypothetical protein